MRTKTLPPIARHALTLAISNARAKASDLRAFAKEDPTSAALCEAAARGWDDQAAALAELLGEE